MEDLAHWVATDKRVPLRVCDLMKEVRRDPFRGIGKPEPLKHLGPDIWSRRITAWDWLVYRVSHESIDFLQARFCRLATTTDFGGPKASRACAHPGPTGLSAPCPTPSPA